MDAYLLAKWEQCIDEAIELPAHHLRTYETNGDLTGIASCDVPTNQISQATERALNLCTSNELDQPTQAQSALSLTQCTSNELN